MAQVRRAPGSNTVIVRPRRREIVVHLDPAATTLAAFDSHFVRQLVASIDKDLGNSPSKLQGTAWNFLKTCSPSRVIDQPKQLQKLASHPCVRHESNLSEFDGEVVG